MKLASLRTSLPDGQLAVVSRDEAHFVTAEAIAPHLLDALDRWETTCPRLLRLYHRLNTANVPGVRAYDPSFSTHGKLMQTAFHLPPIETDRPLMYQGMSHRFLGAKDDGPFPSEGDGVDFEGELGVLTDSVPMGVSADMALAHVRLMVLINDWSLRVIAPEEMKTGFGWIQAKPACSMGPIAITLDEMGTAWSNGRLDAKLRVELNDELFGCVPSTEMEFGFHELAAHAARTRELCAGTIIGSGTLSSSDYKNTGSCCISERRAIEILAQGRAATPFLKFGDRLRMSATVGRDSRPSFGEINQRVVAAFEP